MMIEDRLALELAASVPAIRNPNGPTFYAAPRTVGVSIRSTIVDGLVRRGLMAFTSDHQRVATITDRGRAAIGEPPKGSSPIKGHTAGCELCGRAARLTVAMLKEPWSDNTVKVRACTPCARVAWKTLELIGKARPSR